jgi:uncharacterized membrane protein
MAEEIVKPRGRYGAISLMLALITFSVAMTVTMIAVQTSKAGSIYDVIFPIFAVLVGICAPLAHIVGVALGVAAIVRSGDRPWFGFFGAVLNTLAIATGIGLTYLAAVGLASVR